MHHWTIAKRLPRATHKRMVVYRHLFKYIDAHCCNHRWLCRCDDQIGMDVAATHILYPMFTCLFYLLASAIDVAISDPDT